MFVNKTPHQLSPTSTYSLITISYEAHPLCEYLTIMQSKLATFITVGFFSTIGLLSGCGGSTSEPSVGTDINYSFAQNTDGWDVGFSDYSTLTKPTDVEQVHAVIPIPGASKSLYMGATNLSDDLLLYAYRKVTGLIPNATYTGSFTVTFASDAPAGCAGVGGSPGESVWLIGAVSGTKPENRQTGEDFRLNISRGNQSTAGDSSDVIGTIGVSGIPCSGNNRQAAFKTLGPSKWIPFTTDDTGSAWILIGLDSGFESYSRIWLQSVKFTYQPSVF
jgi:hypothetical protein